MLEELAKKETFSVSLTNSLNDIKDALPSTLNVGRFVQNAVYLLNGNDQLANFARQYGTAQIKLGMIKAATLGLDAMQQEFYLIPYKDQLNFMVDYRGSIKLCKRYSTRPIKDIYAKLVREGDEFSEEIIHGESTINFKPKAFNNGKVIGAFAVCLFQDGGLLYDVMSYDELETTRRQSKASNSPAWQKFTGEMYKKCVLHRLCKHISIDFDNMDQMKYFNEDMEIETDSAKQAQRDIEREANKEEFVIDET